MDDDRDLREFLTEFLLSFGYDVATACDGAEAMQLVHELMPDIILVDLEMPICDGERFYRAIADGSSPVPWVLMMSGAPELPACAARLGIRYLAKPFNVAQLLSKLPPPR